MSRKILIIIALLLFIPLASARELMSDSDCEIASDEVINGLLIVFCENLKISGELNGDLIGAALRTEIDGTINGNIYLVSGQLDVRGYISGDLHFAGAVLRLNPPLPTETDTIDTETQTQQQTIHQQLDGGLKAIALNETLFPQALVQDDVMTFGYQLIIHGEVKGEVNFWGSLLMIEGEIGGNIYANVGDATSESTQLETLFFPLRYLEFDLDLRDPGLVVTEDGRVGGNMFYTGPQLGQINGQILGDTEYDEPVPTVPTLDEPGTLARYFAAFGREFTTLLVIGIIALSSTNQLLYAPLDTMRSRPFASVGVGMLAFLLSFPIILIVILLSLLILGFLQLIGLSGVVVALSLVLGLVNIGGVSVFYFVAIFLGRTLVAFGIGRTILRFRYNSYVIEKPRMRYAALIIGVLLLSLIVSLPVIGILFNALALFWGLGGILNEVITEFNKVADTTPPETATPAWYTTTSAESTRPPTLPSVDIPPVISPPPIDDQPLAPTPGAENLPDGFDWSFFED